MKSVLTNPPVSAGPALALALGIALMAEPTGATIYTVPLQFNITLAAPVCSLKVDSATADTIFDSWPSRSGPPTATHQIAPPQPPSATARRWKR